MFAPRPRHESTQSVCAKRTLFSALLVHSDAFVVAACFVIKRECHSNDRSRVGGKGRGPPYREEKKKLLINRQERSFSPISDAEVNEQLLRLISDGYSSVRIPLHYLAGQRRRRAQREWRKSIIGPVLFVGRHVIFQEPISISFFLT